MLVNKECVGQFNPVVNLTHLHHRWPAVQSEGRPGSDQAALCQLGLRGSQDDLLHHSQPDAQLFEPARMDHHITLGRVRNAQADADLSEHEPRRIIGRSADVGQDHRAEERGRPKGGARKGFQVARSEAGNRLDHQVAPGPRAADSPITVPGAIETSSARRSRPESARTSSPPAREILGRDQRREVPRNLSSNHSSKELHCRDPGSSSSSPTITSRANSTRDFSLSSLDRLRFSSSPHRSFVSGM